MAIAAEAGHSKLTVIYEMQEALQALCAALDEAHQKADGGAAAPAGNAHGQQEQLDRLGMRPGQPQDPDQKDMQVPSQALRSCFPHDAGILFACML